MKHFHLVSAALALAACSTSSWADDGHDARPHTHWWLELTPSWYAGASFERTGFEDWKVLFDDGSITSRGGDDTDAGWRLFAGADLGRYLAVELAYTDFGEAEHRMQSDGSGSFWNAGPQVESVALDSYELELIGRLPLSGDFALFASAGASIWESVYRLSGDSQGSGAFRFDDNGDDVDWSYAAGARYDGFRPIRVVATYRVTPFGRNLVGARQEAATAGVSLAYLF